jgi:hypothetical protein
MECMTWQNPLRHLNVCMCFSLLKLYVTDIFQFDDMLIVATSTSKILINRKANQLPACVNVSYIYCRTNYGSHYWVILCIYTGSLFAQTIKCSLCVFTPSFFSGKNTKDDHLSTLVFVNCHFQVLLFPRNVADIKCNKNNVTYDKTLLKPWLPWIISILTLKLNYVKWKYIM